MKLIIKKEVFSTIHPKLSFVFLYGKNVDNKKNLSKAKHLLKDMEKLARLEFTTESSKTHHLISPTMTAREEFGKKAKHYNTSVEKLLESTLSRKKEQIKDTLNALLHYFSLKYIVPLGSDDFSKIKGDVTFSIATGKEKLKRGTLYYHDQGKILGTKFDYWKNPKTKLTLKSTKALVHLECLPPITETVCKKITTELQELLETFCEGEWKVFILKKNSSIKEIRV